MKTNNILNLAKKQNLCKDYQEKMKNDSSLENLCQMYFEGDDWSMKNDFPDIETLRAFKGKSDIYGLHTDYIGSNKSEFEAAYFGESKIELSYNSYSVSKLILRHDTKAKIKASGNAILIINILDNAEVEIECMEKASVTVFQYDSNQVKSTGNVKVHKSTFKR
ncbi:hypothetical protein DRF62_02060 [Chryseobacterium piscium]|uniref:Uncharacterized protein n=1 Tax=Chryseobacterium piscium TaxID=333702 RepID=A0A3D9BTW3_9FLAO|nr:hypothetical protein [Chryseobacterium piscium]REC56964.1 hypothetical protein DRF62_02060 [Chryseobacterium piscium]